MAACGSNTSYEALAMKDSDNMAMRKPIKHRKRNDMAAGEGYPSTNVAAWNDISQWQSWRNHGVMAAG